MSDAPGLAAMALAPRLRGVTVALRDDLEVSRHVFRGAPTYVFRDPISFQSHAFSDCDYLLLVSLHPQRTLGATFDELVRRGELNPDDEERFFRFVLSLHQLGFLNLPVSDEANLYRRYRSRQVAQQRRLWMSWLFYQAPLWNPDAFLSRTQHLARPLFSTVAFCAWVVLLLAAATVVVARWDALRQPLQGMLAASNLSVMALTMLTLKVFHEFGHAYACRIFGGAVPEMGVILIAGAPCAYVDASAAWGFSSRSKRIVVSLAGMYVELALAAGAVFVWTLTAPGLLNAIAYNTILLASVVTILFNLNPLLRYDGYYVLCDLLEIPNLRARASASLRRLGKRLILGIRETEVEGEPRLILWSYGLLAALYKIVLVFGIAALIATHVPWLGLALAAGFIGAGLVNGGASLLGYLGRSEETRPVRARAVLASVALFGGVPAALFLVPTPGGVVAPAVIQREQEWLLRAEAPGFLEDALAKPGEPIGAGAAICKLTNASAIEERNTILARIQEHELIRDSHRASDTAATQEQEARLAALRAQAAECERRIASLTLRAPADSDVATIPAASEIGRYFDQGTPLARLTSGRWQVAMVLTEAEFDRATPRPGQRVEFRAAAAPQGVVSGVIERIEPRAARQFRLAALTPTGGGAIVVDPLTEQSAEPHFVVIATLDARPKAPLGGVGSVRLAGKSESLGLSCYRSLARFVGEMQRG